MRTSVFRCISTKTTHGLIGLHFFPYSFLTMGAGFALAKAKLFPIEAARGGAQIVLVRGLAN
jgi:hypothetical protein